MNPHHPNSSLLISLLFILVFALFDLAGAPVSASIPPAALAAPTATRPPTRVPSKATPTPARRFVTAGDPPLTAPSSLILQNLDPNNSMHARLSYYDGLSGQLLLQKTAQTILPARNLWISQSSQTGLAMSFSGNALVDSDVPFGMVVVEANGTASSLGTNFKMDAYTGVLTTNPPSTIVAFVSVQAGSSVLGDALMSYEGIAQ